MDLRQRLTAIALVIADEAERNAAFRSRLEEALGPIQVASILKPDETASDRKPIATPPPVAAPPKKKGRRTPALIDPVELARQGEAILRQSLASLNIDQLKDVVAEHGMDPGKLVMKWKDQGRIVERIVELSLARSTKGDAFRADPPPVVPAKANLDKKPLS
jgi:hypothetical protein